MKLRHIEAFNAAMLTGSISGAARLLHVTQPAVTQTLQHAEHQLGYPLFRRTRLGLLPTPEAQKIYPEIQRLMGQLESVRRLTSAIGEPHDSVRILLTPSLGARLLPPAFASFRKSGFSLSARCLQSTEITSAMALREADIGFVYGQPNHPALQWEKVGGGCLVCVSTDFGALDGDSIALEDALRRPFIRIATADPLGAMLSEQCSRFGLQDLESRKEDVIVDSHHLAMTLAEQGVGLAIVDSFTASVSTLLPPHSIRRIEPMIPVDVYALFATGTVLNHRERQVLEAMTSVARKGAVDREHAPKG